MCPASRMRRRRTRPDLDRIIGQERAARAIEFGLDIPNEGYNVFATGPAGAGKTSILTRFLERKAATRPAPSDWAYVYNFDEPDRPDALRLPPGGGIAFRDQMDVLLTQVSEIIEATFTSDQYAESRNAIGRELEQQRGEMIRQLETDVREQGFTLARTPMGMMLTPVVEGQASHARAIRRAAGSGSREAFAERSQGLQERMERTMRHVHELEETAQEKLTQLEEESAAAAIKPFFDRLAAEYAEWPDIIAHLEAVQTHIAAHVEELKAQPGGENPEAAAPIPVWLRADHQRSV